jgi:hypothetical protein
MAVGIGGAGKDDEPMRRREGCFPLRDKSRKVEKGCGTEVDNISGFGLYFPCILEKERMPGLCRCSFGLPGFLFLIFGPSISLRMYLKKKSMLPPLTFTKACFYSLNSKTR